MKNQEIVKEQSGYTVSSWCDRVGISRALFYTLPSGSKPQYVKIGDRTIIFEKPTDWLARMAKSGGVPSKRSALR